jgi:REP element-mobilizing transposase RayT
MARKARVEFAGAVYHVLDRGDRREPIFKDDADRLRFLETLAEVCQRTGWRVHAYVLMSNHYHFLLETPQANLVAGMRWFQTTWTMRFNARHRLSGHLFQGRYKSVVVDAQESRYFAVLSDYIHLNPVRARMVMLDGRLFDFPWSSYPLYVATRGRPEWFEPRAVLGELGLADTAAGRRAYAERMRARAVEELRDGAASPEVIEVRRGWCLGSEGFRERMLRLLDSASERLPGARGSRLEAAAERDHGINEARRLLELGLRSLGLQSEELAGLKKGDERKAAIAALIRRHTAVPTAWIAKELALGHASRVSHCVRDAPPELLRKLESCR